MGLEHAGKESGQVVDIPPAVHIGLAHAQRAVGEDPRVKPLVVDAKVDRSLAVEPDARLLQQRFGAVLQ